MSDAPLLEVRDVHVEFPSPRGVARAVDGVSLTMDSGQVVALVGESGCGKTTLARTIAGYTYRRPVRCSCAESRCATTGAPCASTGACRS